MALRRRHRSGVTFDHLGPARNGRTIRGTSQLPNPIVAETRADGAVTTPSIPPDPTALSTITGTSPSSHPTAVII
ncbi:MAG: hypothetical protein OXC09_04225 [Truepera sp.]|nr:hypothetical protein [Truepera sp.]